MTTRLAINGLGRIGRAVLRIAEARRDVVVVAANDAAPVRQLAPLIARDSVHGAFGGSVTLGPHGLCIDGRDLPVTHETDRRRLDWSSSQPDLVLEATGQCSSRAQAAEHLEVGAPRVVVSANLDDADVTVCLGVNQDALDLGKHRVISNASCTTNCMAPVARVLDREFGLRQGLLTTVHSYARGQELLDGPHEDPRRARAAAINLIPATTGAARAVDRVLPELAGRLDAQAVRVPVPDGSMVQFVVNLEAAPSLEEIALAFRRSAAGDLAGILAVTDEEWVSSDFVGNSHSAIVDLPLLQRVGDRLYRIVAWYDNEWGYANRLLDLAALVGERIRPGRSSAAFAGSSATAPSALGGK
ncbi:MAG: type I glyceraldehyde-3-phosphate dehydrogenase [Thermoanaerobaculia bacterium]|nr:type I glyceraldehyde-3-phosphate dehydrogenase [Thermoanaerobaculia bacterium]